MKTLVDMFIFASILALTACGGSSDSSTDVVNDPASITADPASITAAIEGPMSVDRGQLATFTADTNASISADFEWTLIEESEGSLPVLESTIDQAIVASSQAGTYAIQLIVTDGDAISAPIVQVFDIVDAGQQPPRDWLVGEVNSSAEFLIDVDIKRQLTSPASFVLVGEPTFTRSTQDTSLAFLQIVFDSQNGFGASLRNTAVCPHEWSGYNWNAVFSESLTFCGFL